MPVRLESDPGPVPLFAPPDAGTPSAFARAFRLPPEEAQRYLRGRDRVRLTYDWRELWHEEHARAFTVSRLARADLLQSLHEGIKASVGGDLTRRDWTKNARQLLGEAGWWGEREVPTPDGRLVRTTFNPARLQLIYDVNTRMAYAAGRWERIQAAKATHPYLRYVTRADERVRKSHRPWHNVTLPVDDPFWHTHYPPNGWRCRCRAVPMRRGEYERRDDLIKTAPDEALERWVDSRSGSTRLVPANVDPGFGYNVGQAHVRWQGHIDVLARKANQWEAPIASTMLESMAASSLFAQWYAAPDGSAWPLVRLPDADAQALGARAQVRVASLSGDTLAKQKAGHPELTPADYAQAQGVISHYTHKAQEGRSMIYLRVLPSGSAGGGHVLVVKVTRTGAGLWVTSFRRLHQKDAIRDSEVRRLLKKEGG
jgi:SPP1 gp7 family putative phage head morphogenesis protein